MATFIFTWTPTKQNCAPRSTFTQSSTSDTRKTTIPVHASNFEDVVGGTLLCSKLSGHETDKGVVYELEYLLVEEQ